MNNFCVITQQDVATNRTMTQQLEDHNPSTVTGFHPKDQSLSPILKRTQQFGSTSAGKRYQQDGQLNSLQYCMYREVVQGLGSYSIEELAKIPSFVQVHKEVRHELAKKLINRWKQQIVAEQAEALLQGILKLFPKSSALAALAEPPTPDEQYYYSDKDIVRQSLKDLKITRKMVIDKLIGWRFFPENFYTIK